MVCARKPRDMYDMEVAIVISLLGGTTSQGVQVISRSWKEQEAHSP